MKALKFIIRLSVDAVPFLILGALNQFYLHLDIWQYLALCMFVAVYGVYQAYLGIRLAAKRAVDYQTKLHSAFMEYVSENYDITQKTDRAGR